MTRLASPAHTGRFIRMEIIEPLSLTVAEAAKALDVTRPALSALLDRRSSLSPEMALRIEKAFGVRMDTAYEIAEARRHESRINVQPFVARA